MSRVYTVYAGYKAGVLQYIGTTVQQPNDRFRWHKANGKRLDFKVLSQWDSPDKMLDEEFRLVRELNPPLNKYKKRQTFNVKLGADDLEKRKGSAEWCQRCLKRRVSPGYPCCYYCTKANAK